MLGSQEKILGQKVNVKYFRVDPYTLCNRIPLAFLNLKILHWVFVPNFFRSHDTCGDVRKKQ